MNGRISSSAEPIAVASRREATRLLVALGASCALHALVIVLPYLGQRDQPNRSAAPAERTAARAFIATLATAQRGSVALTLLPGADDKPGAAAHAEPADKPNPPAERTEGLNVLPLPAPAYYTTDQLTKRPQPVVLAELDTAATQPIVASGKLILKLWIDDQGSVADVAVEESNLPETFARAAIAAFKNSRFVPGERNGLRVGTLMRIEVDYDDGRAPGR